MFVSSRSDPLQMMRQVADAEFMDDSSQDEDESISHGQQSNSDHVVGGLSSTSEPKLAQNKEFSAKEAARATNCVGYVVLCLLLFTGAMLSVLTHFYVQGEEREDFEHGVSSFCC